MPMRKNVRRKYMKRKPKGKARSRRGPSIAKFAMRSLPDKLLVKMPYADLQGLVGSGSTSWTFQKAYNINNLYDPETAALNQQNLMFEQYSTLYGSYRVYKVDYDVTLVNTANSTTAGSISFARTGEQMNILDIQQLNAPYSRRFTLGVGGSTSSAQNMKRIKGSISLPRVVGFTSEQFRTSTLFSSQYGTTNPGSPFTNIQMSINGINVNTGITATVQCDVRYTCHVEWFDRRTSILTGTDAPIEEA